MYDDFVSDIRIFCETLLIVSGDVELNPGPSKACLKCEKSVHNRTIVCSCGHMYTLESENKMIQSSY